jgi:tetratricopeptide (TPR) repeat protein
VLVRLFKAGVKTLLNYLYRAPLSWHGLHDVRSQPSPNAVVLRQLKCLIAVGLLIAVIIPLPAGAEGTPLPTGPNLSELETQDAVLASSVPSDPSEVNYKALARLRLQIARVHFASWQKSGVEDDLNQALIYSKSAANLDPANSDAPGLIGAILSDAPDNSELLATASELLADALIINPDQPVLRVILASTLIRQWRFWSAVTIYEDLFEQYPAMISSANTSMLALSYIADGRVTAGINYFQALEQRHPENSGVLSALASLYKHAGDMGQALQALTRLVYGSDAGPLQREYAQSLLRRWVQQ